MIRNFALSAAVVAVAGLSAATDWAIAADAAGDVRVRPYEITEKRAECAEYDPLRRPLFGDLHVHTAYSFDASTQDTRNTPRDAYRFARGAKIGVQPYDAEGNPAREIQLGRPLDFVAVTDHQEMLGEVRLCMSPDAPEYDALICKIHRNYPRWGFQFEGWWTLIGKMRFGMCGDDGERCLSVAEDVWGEIREAAEESYDRSEACRFTSFVGYEWTSILEDGINLHRNVIFRNEKVPDYPPSWVETPNAMDLWNALQSECVDGRPGCDALTIPHNSNISAGLMFGSVDIKWSWDLGVPMNDEEIRRRNRWEPIVEIMQHKGDSECRIGLGTTDELCNFEPVPYDRFGPWFSPLARVREPIAANFVREALKSGLRIERDRGANPLKYGIIASTDTHIGAPGFTDETNHGGHGGAGMSADEQKPTGFPDNLEFNPGGLAVLWAEENTRDSLFAALKRREAYGTSGTRPLVRFFGGWDYPEDLCGSAGFVRRGYAGGVPMGQDLPVPGEGDEAPRFAVWAQQDAGDPGRPGTPLQRVQIVKGWLDGDTLREETFDVAGGPNDAGVDVDTCTPYGEGATELCTVWTDPDFDAADAAFYYVRVLENPTCRWSQYVCNAAELDCDDAASVPTDLTPCCSADHQATVQERAWTSPIWYTPAP